MDLDTPTYVYRSEGGHGQTTFVATCAIHARDVCIHPNPAKASKVAKAHARLWHPYGEWAGHPLLPA